MTWRGILKTDLVLAFAFLLAATGLIHLWRAGWTSGGIDYYHFWLFPQIVTRGESKDIYSPEEARRLGGLYLERANKKSEAGRLQNVAAYREVLDPSATPFLYTAFRPFVSGDYERDYTRFLVFSLVIGAAAILALGRMMSHTWTACFAALALFSWTFEPLQTDMRVGNVNQLQLGVLALALFFCKRADRPGSGFLAGAVLGLAAMFKPNLAVVPAALGLSMVIYKRWLCLGRLVAGCAAGAVPAFVASVAFFGSAECWRQWLATLPRVMARMEIKFGNYGLSRLIFDVTGTDLSSLLLVACVLGLVTALWLGKRHERQREGDPSSGIELGFDRDYLVLSLACAAGLLFSSLAWGHYFTLLVPIWLYLLRPLPSSEGVTTASVAARQWAALLMLAVFLSWPHPNILGRDLSFQKAVECSFATIVLFGLGLWQLARPTRPTPALSTREPARRR